MINLDQADFQIHPTQRPLSCLGQSQVLDSKGQEHFANSSLTALNLLRLEDRAWALSKSISLRHRVGSVGSLKLRKYNQLLLNRLIATLPDI